MIPPPVFILVVYWQNPGANLQYLRLYALCDPKAT